MCKCTPAIRTPFCGKGECVWPHKKKGQRLMKKLEHPMLKDLPENCNKIFLIPKDSKGIKGGDILIAMENQFAGDGFVIDIESWRKQWDEVVNQEPRIFRQ